MSIVLPDGNDVVPGLYRSVRGEIACIDHAPTVNGVRWIAEGWNVVTADDNTPIAYRCQHCGGSTTTRSPHQRF